MIDYMQIAALARARSTATSLPPFPVLTFPISRRRMTPKAPVVALTISSASMIIVIFIMALLLPLQTTHAAAVLVSNSSDIATPQIHHY
jgi:hypothetical protein